MSLAADVLQMTSGGAGTMARRPDPDMSAEQDQPQPESSRPSAPVQQQQQPQPEREGHGRGSDSALRQLRIWEERRAVQSGGKRRQGPQ